MFKCHCLRKSTKAIFQFFIFDKFNQFLLFSISLMSNLKNKKNRVETVPASGSHPTLSCDSMSSSAVALAAELRRGWEAVEEREEGRKR